MVKIFSFGLWAAAVISGLMAAGPAFAEDGGEDYFCEPVLGERTDSPYKPYTCREAGDYVPQDYEGDPAWNPEWLKRMLRHPLDLRRPPVMSTGNLWYDRNCNCLRVIGTDEPIFNLQRPACAGFYCGAMKRSSEAFGDTKPFSTYGNYQYRFENQLRSIR